MGFRRWIRGELLERPGAGAGWSTLGFAFVIALIWVMLSYLFPGSYWNAKFLVAAVCLGLWGTADLFSIRLLWVAAALRAAVFVLLVAAAVWILSGW